MTADFHFYEPRLGHGLPHDPFNAIVGPRPIGWISSRSAGTFDLTLRLYMPDAALLADPGTALDPPRLARLSCEGAA